MTNPYNKTPNKTQHTTTHSLHHTCKPARVIDFPLTLPLEASKIQCCLQALILPISCSHHTCILNSPKFNPIFLDYITSSLAQNLVTQDIMSAYSGCCF
ncbi:hypothetical protein P3S67_022824 [Capsicum chacoense]